MTAADYVQVTDPDAKPSEGQWQAVFEGARRVQRRRRTVKTLAGISMVTGLLVFGWSALHPTHSESPRLAANTGASFRLTDGSEALGAADARLLLLADTAQEQRLSLEHGRATFDVVPRRQGAFVVVARNVEVKVVGTRFSVALDDRHQAVTVDVEQGIVEVSQPGLAPRRLTRGDYWDSSLGASVAAVTSPDTAPATSAQPPEPLTAVSALAPTTSASAAPQSSSQGPLSADTTRKLQELFATASRARAHGDWTAAREALSAIVARDPKGELGSLAALELGRIELQQGGSSGAAARSLERSLKADPHSPLREETLARLVQAYEQAGQTQPCRQARERYRREFPKGALATSVAKRCEGGR